MNKINTCSDEIIQWRKNLFKLPSGKASKDFINELTECLNHYNIESENKGIAIKVHMILPSILLQKPSKTSKAKEHLAKLGQRMLLWKEGKVDDLMRENRCIQRKLQQTRKHNSEDTARIFAKLMFQGKVNAALKFLSEENDHGIHELNNEVIETLKEKHPKPAKIHEDILLQGPIDIVTPAYFDSIDESMIKNAARLTKGAAGPSNLDAEQYKLMLVSNKFRKEGKELRTQIAILAKNIATKIVNPDELEAYTSCRLIPLDKNPGVRPIGIGEIIRRITGKTIAWVLKDDIQESAGPLQVSTGIKGGAEAAIHAMKQLFEDDCNDAVILVDANNAFNSMNRQVALHNIQYICPPFATILINTYRKPSRLIILGGAEILSEEGSAQGDNLAMAFYGLNTRLLIDILKVRTQFVKQVCLPMMRQVQER